MIPESERDKSRYIFGKYAGKVLMARILMCVRLKIASRDTNANSSLQEVEGSIIIACFPSATIVIIADISMHTTHNDCNTLSTLCLDADFPWHRAKYACKISLRVAPIRSHKQTGKNISSL